MSPDLRRAVLELLREVESRPGMFVGSDSPTDQLRNLQWLLVGFELGYPQSTGDTPRGGFLGDFGEYLRTTHGWSVARGPIAAVISAATGDKDRWVLFWKCVHEYEERSLGDD